MKVLDPFATANVFGDDVRGMDRIDGPRVEPRIVTIGASFRD
jgi:hypothetical protein